MAAATTITPTVTQLQKKQSTLSKVMGVLKAIAIVVVILIVVAICIFFCFVYFKGGGV